MRRHDQCRTLIALIVQLSHSREMVGADRLADAVDDFVVGHMELKWNVLVVVLIASKPCATIFAPNAKPYTSETFGGSVANDPN